MTKTTAEIFEKYEIRKTKKQKTAFIEYVTEKCQELNCNIKIEKGLFGSRNIVVGDPDNAKVIYTAHYDTCAALPFPNLITPKNFLLYLLYQFAIVFIFFIIAFIIGFPIGLAGTLMGIKEYFIAPIAYIIYFCLIYLLIAGPANKHTANDNTSGVTVLLDIMTSLPIEQRDNVSFVFFDLEESGLFGSVSFASKHKKIKKEKLVVNFDCVSDGNNILLILKKKARKYADAFKNAFPSTENINSEIVTKPIFYPSDQSQFKHGVGVAAFKKTKGSLLYLNRIHTKRDTVYQEQNIEFLKNGAITLLSLI